jgi:hypothetical protein
MQGGSSLFSVLRWCFCLSLHSLLGLTLIRHNTALAISEAVAESTAISENILQNDLYQAAQISFSAKLDDQQLRAIAESEILQKLLAKAVSYTICNHQKGDVRPLANSVVGLRIEGLSKRSTQPLESGPQLRQQLKELVDVKLGGHISLVMSQRLRPEQQGNNINYNAVLFLQCVYMYAWILFVLAAVGPRHSVPCWIH